MGAAVRELWKYYICGIILTHVSIVIITTLDLISK